MEHPETSWGVLRKIGFLALLGFGAVVLSGPILAILSVVLSVAAVVGSFALLGLLIWGLFQAAIHGPQVAGEKCRALMGSLGQAARSIGKTAVKVVAFPFRVLGTVGAVLLMSVWFLVSRLWLFTRFLSGTAILAVIGALLGAAVGAFTGAQNHDIDVAIATNAAIGAVVAALVGVALTIHERKGKVRARYTAAVIPPLRPLPADHN